jgi:hypothetical protein
MIGNTFTQGTIVKWPRKVAFSETGLVGFSTYFLMSHTTRTQASITAWSTGTKHMQKGALVCTGTGRLGDEKRRKTDSTKTCVGLFRIRMVGPGFLPPPATHKDVCRGGHTESRSREGLKESIHRLIHSIEMYPGSFLHEYRFTKMRIAALAPPQPPPHTSRSPLSVVGR